MSSNTDNVTIIVPIVVISDAVLSAPIISRLEAVEEFEVHTVHLFAPDFKKSYEIMDSLILIEDPDFVLLVGDRIEMCAAMAACFHNDVRAGHMYAGVTNSIATLDDINRHVMTLWSDIQFCEDTQAVNTVRALTSAVGLPCNAYYVGITHFDDIDIDKIRKSELYNDYDMVLYNPVTWGNVTKAMISDVDEIVKAVKHNVLLLSPNADPGNNIATAMISDTLQDKGIKVSVMLTDAPHDKFLSVLKGCEQFITNSSAAIYEAPVLLEPDQIVHIGNRNWARAKGPFMTGASDNIVDILKAKLLDEVKP